MPCPNRAVPPAPLHVPSPFSLLPRLVRGLPGFPRGSMSCDRLGENAGLLILRPARLDRVGVGIRSLGAHNPTT